MTEEELEQKRKDFRDNEVQSKISEYSKTDAYHAQTIKTHYTKHIVDRRLPKIGMFLIIAQASFIFFFSTLYVFSYHPKAKIIVAKIMP